MNHQRFYHAGAVLSVGILAGMLLILPLRAQSATQDQAIEVFNDQTIWRFHMTYRPANGKCEKAIQPTKLRWVRWGERLAGPLPEVNWMKMDFDDSGWPRRRGPFLGGYGDKGSRYIGTTLICVRGRFGVTNPEEVKDLKLTLIYRGGVVVYINGKEVARKHLPKGIIEPLTPAQEYPRKAFVKPGTNLLLPNIGSRKPPRRYRYHYAARIRRLTINIPIGTLRKGANVVAIELHRTAIPTNFAGPHRVQWETVGLCSAKLTAEAGSAVVPSLGAPQGVQVWNAEPMLRVGVDADYGDATEKLRPIQLMAPRNGVSSGQVVVSDRVKIPGLKGKMSDLKSSEGFTISANAVRVRYAKPFGEKGFTALLDKPTDSTKIQPIWLTVKVPTNARAGKYEGKLTISGLDKFVMVPVKLTVYGWKIDNPRDWKTSVNLLQSPESVAGYYKVPLWSDEHFKLMEKSLELMGQAGNDILGISAIGKNVFGNDPIIIFRKNGGRYEPKFKLLERYLDLYNKYAGEPMFLSLHVWGYGTGPRQVDRNHGKAVKDAKMISVVELQRGELMPVELPVYGEAGTEKLWKQVMDGLRECVKKQGWREECILLGTSGDGWPDVKIINFFKKVAPYARWRAITHCSGVPKWGKSRQDRTQPNGMVVGYLELVRRITNKRLKLKDCPVACNARDCLGSDPFDYRSLPSINMISANYDGFCWKGLDYWPYMTADGTKRSALNTYVHFGNIVGPTPRTIAAPGPHGAVATVQYEMLREGIQDCEAMLFICEALNNGQLHDRIGNDLARRCEKTKENLLCLFETGLRYSPHGGGNVRRHVARLYATTAELTEAITK
jgi:hypothetical protein